MKVIDKINGSGLFAQSAFSADTATKDNLGRDITATYLTGVNIPESAAWNEASNVVSSNSAQWSEGKTYDGISPIVVNNTEDKISADTWTLSAGEGVSFTEDSANKVTRIDVTAQGGNYIPYTAVETAVSPSFETNSGLSINRHYNGILNSTYLGNNLIKISYIGSTLNDYSVLSNDKLKFITNSDSAYFDREKIHTWDSASNYIQTISSTYYPKSNPSSFATESWVNGQGFLTAHQDISNKLDSSAFSSVSGDFLTTSFSIPESAVWNETSNVVQTNSAQWGQGGGGSVSSKYGTISVADNNIEATNKAIEFNSNGFTSSFDAIFLDEYNPPRSITWDNYSQGTTLTFNVLNGGNSDPLAYSSNTNVTGLITAAQYTPTDVSLTIPNATAIQFSANHSYTVQSIQVTAPTSFKVRELAWKSDLPTYSYTNNKVSAINGSALVGNEDYLVEQGFVQNLTSPKGTISVLNNNKIEGTNSAIASDVIEGFVSAYNAVSVYPEHSATLTWDRYVPNTMLFVSGAEYQEHTLTYSANTDVTGVITTTTAGQISVELPTDSTSIVIGNEDWGNTTFNFTVSAENYYEIGELAWASALPTYEYDNTNKISAINGSALAGGSDVPSGTMNVSGLEYNAVNEISAYNGSAIAQYGAEKQWLVHDDTLVHAANSAQYALGVNVSALQRLMGIDETVLFENDTLTTNNGYKPIISLSEPASAFKTLKFVYGDIYGNNALGYTKFLDTEHIWDYGTSGGILLEAPFGYVNGGSRMSRSTQFWFANNTNTLSAVMNCSVVFKSNWTASQMTSGDGTTANLNKAVKVFKIIGIGRKA